MSKMMAMNKIILNKINTTAQVIFCINRIVLNKFKQD